MDEKSTPLARPAEKWPRVIPIPEAELEAPALRTVLAIVWNTFARLFHDPIGMILGSAFLLIMVWGPHGNLELLGLLWDGWEGPGSAPADGRARILPGIPWDQEWISYAAGVVLVVVVPALLVRFVYRQPLRAYGLGLPPRGRGRLALLSAALLLALCLPAFYLGAKDEGMRRTYPLYRGAFGGAGEFVLYELGYFAFFVAIEFVFRGYLLFGLFGLRDRDAPPGVAGAKGPLVFGVYAVFVSMLSYTAWHLGKPVPELWGTLVWGVAAGSIALATRTIWPIVAVHWLLNVFLDLVIWQGWA